MSVLEGIINDEGQGMSGIISYKNENSPSNYESGGADNEYNSIDGNDSQRSLDSNGGSDNLAVDQNYSVAGYGHQQSMDNCGGDDNLSGGNDKSCPIDGDYARGYLGGDDSDNYDRDYSAGREAEGECFLDGIVGAELGPLDRHTVRRDNGRSPIDLHDGADEIFIGGGIIKYNPDTTTATTTNVKDDTIAKLIPDKISAECSLVAPDPDICLSTPALTKIAADYKIEQNDPAQVIEAAKEHTGCDSQRCIARHLPRNMQEAEAANFKIDGPTNVDWLSNTNIDKTLESWTKKFPDFYHCHFSMADYEQKNDELANISLKQLYQEGIRTFGCVINTDKYSGRGQHWMALFGDMRNSSRFSVEFFNSSGNQPQISYATWLIREKNGLSIIAPTEIIKNCRIRHQNSKTECGVYSLFYIYARLKGVPAEYFAANIVDDKLMMEMRLHLFNDRRRPNPPEKFNYAEQFQAIAQWEPN